MAKVHLMRLAVQDLRTSHIRKRAKRLGKPEVWLLYQELLWALHENGGTLSSDPEVLADEVEFFAPDQIRELLPLLAPGDGKRGGIVVEGNRIKSPRVSEEVAQESAFSRQQAIRGRRGGRAKARAEYEVKEGKKASKRQANAKPSVAVSVAVSPSSPSSTEGGTEGLPPADRAERAIKASTDGLRSRLYALVSEAAEVDPKKRDPTELMRLFTSYDRQPGRNGEGGGTVKGVVNAALLTHERLERSIADAEGQIAEWRDGTRQAARRA